MDKREWTLADKRWLIAVVAFTILTLLAVYAIPNDSYLIVFRYIFGFIFISFIPGYCLVQLLFAKNGKVDVIEKLVLSVALSFSITSLVGLFLGLTAIGINLTSVTVSLTAVVLLLSLFALAVSHKR
ncbi:MAG: DUF1616 domain-containing protein [Candidatus Bathyarchaeia archaeon]